MTQINRVKAVFDEWAENGRAGGMEDGHGPTAIQAFNRLNLAPKDRYLDIGCGNGYTLRWAKERVEGANVWGIDVAPKMIALAQQMSTEGDKSRYLVGEFPHQDVPDNNFDAIFSMEVFYYMPSIDEGLRGVAKALKPGGHFVCTVDYYKENPACHSWPEDTGVSMTLWSAEDWKTGFERAGLEVVEQCRLRPQSSTDAPGWKHSEGSLMTLGKLRSSL